MKLRKKSIKKNLKQNKYQSKEWGLHLTKNKIKCWGMIYI